MRNNAEKNGACCLPLRLREGRREHAGQIGEIAMTSLMRPELLGPSQLAARWGLSEKTLERWRMLGTGPVFIKLGGRVLYRIGNIEAHEQRHTRSMRMAALAASTGAAVIVSHHFAKREASTPEQTREAIRGTGGLVDGVRAGSMRCGIPRRTTPRPSARRCMNPTSVAGWCWAAWSKPMAGPISV